jgi:isopentenyl phosphate kinase
MHAPPPTLPGGVHCVVKLGGSCITEKYRQQQLRPGVLASVVADLAALHAQHPGGSFIVVHGAGSFGHHEASKYGLAQPAGRPQALLREGFAKTRLAITKLNHAVVSALVDAGVPAVGLSPCGTWFRTPTAPDQVENSAGVAAVATLLQQGLVPVLHGDGILELHVGQPPGQLAPSILSGDVIVRRLAEVFSPRFCCFLSDVPGLLSKPPSEPGAELLPLVLVSRNDRGSVTWRACSSSQQQQQPEAVAPQLSAAAFDTTGGIAAKVLESAAVAVEGCPVVIAQGGTPSGTTAVLHGPDAFAATGGSSSSQALQATVVRLA